MRTFCFIPFPDLKTRRFALRQLSIEDDKEIFALRSNDSVNEYLDRPKAISIEEAQQFIHKINGVIAKGESIYWAITLRDDNKLIGTICFWKFSKEHSTAEIGYELLPAFQGKGIMQEIIPTVIEYGFESIKLHAITAELSPRNIKSIRLLERNHFVRIPGFNSSNDQKENVVSYIFKRTTSS